MLQSPHAESCVQELHHDAQLTRADFCADGSLVRPLVLLSSGASVKMQGVDGFGGLFWLIVPYLQWIARGDLLRGLGRWVQVLMEETSLLTLGLGSCRPLEGPNRETPAQVKASWKPPFSGTSHFKFVQVEVAHFSASVVEPGKLDSGSPLHHCGTVQEDYASRSCQVWYERRQG